MLDGSGVAHALDLSNRDGFTRLTDTVLHDAYALPRAFVLPQAQAFSPARHAGLTATQLVASPDVDLHTMVLIEGDSDAGTFGPYLETLLSQTGVAKTTTA